jgi:hypothetical protein
MRWRGARTEVVEVSDATVVPGFVDAHCHPRPVYPFESQHTVVDLGPDKVKSIDELIALLRRKTAKTPKGRWIRGRGYQDSRLGRHPSRHDLDNLVAIVDHNKLQQFGWRGETAEDREPPEGPGELVAKFRAFGWRVIEIDGNDMRAVVDALEAACRPEGKPVAIVANTIKGKGVSFMEGDYKWHIGVPTDEQFSQAMTELGESSGDTA